jgi:peptide/nickel transport system substrate-binding protein
MKALDDRRFEIALAAPFPQMTLALSEFCYVMPERIALTDANVRIAEVIGSGPFRFLPDEWESGARVAYARFDGYVPREEPPSFMAGGKVAMFDRVEWQVVSDPATAAAALLKGEVDWVQQPLSDMLGVLRANPDVRVLSNDKVGVMGMLALNHLQPPFDNQALRQAVLQSVAQRDFMEAAVGEDPSMFRVPIGVFTPGLGMASDAGLAVLEQPAELERGRAMVRASGYKGETALVMGAADSPVTQAMAQVAAELFRQLGLKVEYVSMDLGTLVQRRASKAAPDKGGWSAFTTTYEGLTMADPATNVALRGNGADAWYGWPSSPKLEALRDQWLDTADPAAQRGFAAQMQAVALQEVPFVPLGQIFYPTAVRSDIGSLIPSPFPVFWNVRRG